MVKARAKQIFKRAAITGGLQAARVLGRAGMMRSARGRGAIFTLHHVRPKVHRAFDPNAHLEITPEFLEAAIRHLQDEDYVFLPLAELPAFLTGGDTRPVAVFTLDDGYRNNLDHAAPVFARHGVPFTVFVAKGFAERTQTAWWETLAELLAATDVLDIDLGSGRERLTLGGMAARNAAFARLAAFIHEGDEAPAVSRVDAVARGAGIDPARIIERLTLDAEGLAGLASHPMATLGAHTVSHRALARLTDAEAQQEIDVSMAYIEDITGRRPTTFAYPYGDRSAVSERDRRIVADLGLTAVTTRPGTLLTGPDLTALPRISLNGHFQNAAYVGALASGIPFRLMGAR